MATLKPRKIIKDSATEIVEESKLEKKKTEERIAFLEAQLEKFIERDSESKIDITSDDYIKVMSLSPVILNLCTRPYGQGKNFKFNKFGEVKRILYKDIVEILETNPTFAESGLFYILDTRVIARHGLDDVYLSILDKSRIDRIFSENNTDAMNLYRISNPKQQEVIREMLVDKMRDNEDFDLNLVAAISKYSKVNLQEKIDDAKEFNRIKDKDVEIKE